MISLLVNLLIVCLILGVVYWVITLVPLPHPFSLVVRVIFALIVIIVLLGVLGVFPGAHLRL